MIFNGQSRKLVIKPKPLLTLYELEQRSGANESGGILLGKVYTDHVFVEEITKPNILDKYGQYFFIRSMKTAQRKINKFWRRSDGTVIYLGEWHTHQEANPRPSNVDRKMIHDALNNTIMEIDFLFLLIIGQKKTIWAGLQTKDGLEELEKIS